MDIIMEIRDATAADWPSIWPFFDEIVQVGETYAYDPGMDSDAARARRGRRRVGHGCGVHAIEFNAVVETNTAAVILWTAGDRPLECP